MDYGLTEYQARVYLTLLDLGTATASEVPALSRVPRTRIYQTMRQLHEKGLVEILPESPLRYKPVAFAAFLRATADELRERAGQVESSLDALSREFAVLGRVAPERRGSFEAIHGRRNVRERLLRMYEGAQEEVFGIGTTRSPGRILKAFGPTLTAKAKAGIVLRYAFPFEAGNREDVKLLLRNGEVRHIDFGMPVYMHVVDGRQFLMSHPIPDDDSFTKGDDISIWTDDPAVARAMARIAERIWETGTPPPPELVAEARGVRKG
ncbi:MAG: hypothetical protein A3K59_07120 [Euryarchaeota archaeon RBG_19FT_COMBO_69_17]|nr:MAG: hypothetical protein A3K59_07120 [Euryarchaeota archaeon RBG_19FT_COMBO_69_17]